MLGLWINMIPHCGNWIVPCLFPSVPGTESLSTSFWMSRAASGILTQHHVRHYFSNSNVTRIMQSIATLHGSELQTSTFMPVLHYTHLGISFIFKTTLPSCVVTAITLDKTSWSLGALQEHLSIPITVTSATKTTAGCCWHPPQHHLP